MCWSSGGGPPELSGPTIPLLGPPLACSCTVSIFLAKYINKQREVWFAPHLEGFHECIIPECVQVSPLGAKIRHSLSCHSRNVYFGFVLPDMSQCPLNLCPLNLCPLNLCPLNLCPLNLCPPLTYLEPLSLIPSSPLTQCSSNPHPLLCKVLE